LFCHNVLQPKSSLPQLLHTYKCRITTPALHTVIHCTLHCTLHCLLHCSLHCTLHYTLHCTLHAALIQCATAAREQYFPVLSKGRSPEDETLYCTVCSAQCIGHWTALCTAHCTGHCTAALDTYLGTALDTGLDTALDNALHAALLHCCTALHFCTDTVLDWTHLLLPGDICAERPGGAEGTSELTFSLDSRCVAPPHAPPPIDPTPSPLLLPLLKGSPPIYFSRSHWHLAPGTWHLAPGIWPWHGSGGEEGRVCEGRSSEVLGVKYAGLALDRS
jgi:hypothetical protein